MIVNEFDGDNTGQETPCWHLASWIPCDGEDLGEAL